MNTTLATIAEIINNLSPDISFDPQTDCDRSLTDIGIDSLDNMSLFLELQDRFDIEEIPDADIDRLPTVHSIVDYLHQRLDKAA